MNHRFRWYRDYQNIRTPCLVQSIWISLTEELFPKCNTEFSWNHFGNHFAGSQVAKRSIVQKLFLKLKSLLFFSFPYFAEVTSVFLISETKTFRNEKASEEITRLSEL